MKEELAIRAAKLFPKLFPDAWKHKLYRGICVKCQSNNPLGDCEVMTNIDINWDNAMRLFREVNRKQRCFAMLQITETRRPETFKNLMTIYPDISADKNPLLVAFSAGYFNHDATPADYIEAACIAKEKETD